MGRTAKGKQPEPKTVEPAASKNTKKAVALSFDFSSSSEPQESEPQLVASQSGLSPKTAKPKSALAFDVSFDSKDVKLQLKEEKRKIALEQKAAEDKKRYEKQAEAARQKQKK